MLFSWPMSVFTQTPLFKSHILMVLSLEPLINLSLEYNFRHSTESVCSLSVRIQSPLLIFHNLIVLSSEQLINWPIWLNLRSHTASVWPFSIFKHLHVSICHMEISLSLWPHAISLLLLFSDLIQRTQSISAMSSMVCVEIPEFNSHILRVLSKEALTKSPFSKFSMQITYLVWPVSVSIQHPVRAWKMKKN